MNLALMMLLAQAEDTAPAGRSGGGYEGIIFIVLIFAVLYFLMIRPQKKKEQKRREMLKQIERGDRVVTIGGIHGEIASVKENTVILLVDRESGGTLKMSRSAVHRIVSDESDENE
jgi:preprotein translocase subunit YajC